MCIFASEYELYASNQPYINHLNKQYKPLKQTIMKKILLIVSMVLTLQMLQAGVYTFESFRNSRVIENGILLQAAYSPIDEDDENGVVISNSKIELPAPGVVTISTGCVNIKKIVLHLYSGSDVPHLTMTATEGSVETVKEPEKTVTWTNTGKAVATVELRLAETADPSDVQYQFQKNKVQIVSADIEIDGDWGYYGVVDGILKDTIDIEPSKVALNRSYNTFWEEWEYTFTATDRSSGHTVSFSFTPYWDEVIEDEYEEYSGGEVEVPNEGTYDAKYVYLNIAKNAQDTLKHDVKFEMIAENLILYRLTWTGVLSGEETNHAYDEEPKTATTLNFVGVEADYDDDNVQFYNELEVTMYDKDYNDIILVFMVDDLSSDNVIPRGEYEINDTKQIGTVMASTGYDDWQITEGSRLELNVTEEENGVEYLETVATYFIVSGKVKVETTAKGVKLTINATSYNGSTINGVYEGTIPGISTGVENMAVTASEAPRYNVLGTEVGKDYKGIVIQGKRKYAVME